MKILLISDEESPYLWDFYQPGRLDGIDLILSCGDLAPEYLSFLVTMGRAPLFYVHGNHDGCYAKTPPEGCECIEDRIVEFQGVRILGLGGCYRYSQGEHQYTERQMEQRIRRLHRSLKRSQGVDIIITHAPVSGFGDDSSYAHRGFQAFRTLLEEQKPRYWVYGHVHLRYSNGQPRLLSSGNTQLINACERYMIDIDPVRSKTKRLFLK